MQTPGNYPEESIQQKWIFLFWKCRILLGYVFLQRDVCLHSVYCLFYPSSIFGIEGTRVFRFRLFTVFVWWTSVIFFQQQVKKMLAVELKCSLKIVWYSSFIKIKVLYVSNMYLFNMYLMECSHDIYYFLTVSYWCPDWSTCTSEFDLSLFYVTPPRYYLYVALPKISENLLVIIWILSLSPNFHRHLRSSPLGLYTTIPAILPLLEAHIEVCRR
jgi:hypothetical protein